MKIYNFAETLGNYLKLKFIMLAIKKINLTAPSLKGAN